MANVRVRNVIYVDATGTVTVDALRPRLYGMLVTPSAATGRITIKESVSGTIVVDYLFSTLATVYISFCNENLNGVELSKAFEISTLTTISTAQLYGNWNLPAGRAT